MIAQCWLMSRASLLTLTGGARPEIPSDWFQWGAGGNLRRIELTDDLGQSVVADWLAKVEEEGLRPVILIGRDELLPELGEFNPSGDPWQDALEVLHFDPVQNREGMEDLVQILRYPDAEFVISWSGFVRGTNQYASFPALESPDVAASYTSALRYWIEDCSDKDLGGFIGFDKDKWEGRQFTRADFSARPIVSGGMRFFGLTNFPYVGLERVHGGVWRSTGPLPADVNLFDESGELRQELSLELERAEAGGVWHRGILSFKLFLQEIVGFRQPLEARAEDRRAAPDHWIVYEYETGYLKQGWLLIIRAPEPHELGVQPFASLRFPGDKELGRFSHLKLSVMVRRAGSGKEDAVVLFLGLDSALPGFNSGDPNRIRCSERTQASSTFWEFDLPSSLFTHLDDEDECIGIRVDVVRGTH